MTRDQVNGLLAYADGLIAEEMAKLSLTAGDGVTVSGSAGAQSVSIERQRVTTEVRVREPEEIFVLTEFRGRFWTSEGGVDVDIYDPPTPWFKIRTDGRREILETIGAPGFAGKSQALNTVDDETGDFVRREYTVTFTVSPVRGVRRLTCALMYADEPYGELSRFSLNLGSGGVSRSVSAPKNREIYIGFVSFE